MRIAFLVCLVLFMLQSHAQVDEKLPFCGMYFRDAAKLREQLAPQFEFLRVQENDTIVDIGAASGWFEGAFSVWSPLKRLSFLLLDISNTCLNRPMVDKMIAHYSGLKGSPITHTFELIRNTPDSLFLPQNLYGKVWLFNTLHELPDKEKMARDISSTLRKGGELVVLELQPRKEGQLHGGCNLPLLNAEAIKGIFQKEGFSFIESKDVSEKGRKTRVWMFRFVRN